MLDRTTKSRRQQREEWETVEEEFAFLMSKIAKRKLTPLQAHEFNRELLRRQRDEEAWAEDIKAWEQHIKDNENG